ncbi:MAG: protein jag [Candidatus Nanopelagicaceae bacterium]
MSEVVEQVEMIEKVEKKSLVARLEEEGDVAADYLEALLDIADLDGDIDIDVENDRASLSIAGGTVGDLGHLVGERGEVLDAIQELTRLAVQTSTGERSRLMLDIDNFRSEKKAELAKLAHEVAEQVKASGESMKLRPMNAFERKVVHDTIQEIGLTSESEGEDPNRCVVVLPE